MSDVDLEILKKEKAAKDEELKKGEDSQPIDNQK